MNAFEKIQHAMELAGGPALVDLTSFLPTETICSHEPEAIEAWTGNAADILGAQFVLMAVCGTTTRAIELMKLRGATAFSAVALAVQTAGARR